MNLKCLNYSKNKKIKLVALGDWHVGAKECDEKLLKEKIEWIRQQKDVIVVLMGDLINAGTRASIGAGTYDDKYNPQEQYEKVLEWLKPIKNKIAMALQGNHEIRIFDLSSFDITKMLCRELGIYYAKDGIGFLKIRVGNQNYVVAATHGSTGAATSSGKMNGCIKMSNFIDADIYLMGHVHSLSHNVELYRKVNLKNKIIEEHERHYVLTGSFLTFDNSYGERKGYAPLKKGMPTLHLNGEKFDVQVEM